MWCGPHRGLNRSPPGQQGTVTLTLPRPATAAVTMHALQARHSCASGSHVNAGPGSRPVLVPRQIAGAVSRHTLRCKASGSSQSPFAPQPSKQPKGTTADIAAAASTSSGSPSITSSTAAGYSQHKWTWKGHTINYVTAGCGRPVVLVHGFGANLQHYRKTIPALAPHFKVYAIDLLGFGDSDKPVQQYTIETWGHLVADFMGEFVGEQPAVLVGNSIGSLVCLTAANDLPPSRVAGLVLLNCAGAMNNKGVLTDWRIILAYPLFLLIDLLLSIRPLASYLFESFRTKQNVANVLGSVYRNPAAVDDELVEIITAPSDHPNALDVFTSVITGPPGPKPWELLPNISSPLLVVWGDKDPFTPLDGPVGQYMKQLSSSRPLTDFLLLQDVGHCPQDDRPELLHDKLIAWLKEHSGAAAAATATAAGPQVADQAL